MELKRVFLYLFLSLPFCLIAKVTERQAERSVKELYGVLEYTVNKGDVNTDGEYWKRWKNLVVEGAKFPNEPLKLGFLWKESIGHHEFLDAYYYFGCYAQGRGKVQEIRVDVKPKVIPARKPDLATALSFDVDYYHLTASKYMRVNGHPYNFEDEIYVKAENGCIAYVKNRYGGDVPDVLTDDHDICEIFAIIAEADYMYTVGQYAKSYSLYKKVVASGMLTTLAEADASYRLAILLYYYAGDCEPSMKRKEVNRRISAYLTHAENTGGWYISDKVVKARYYMENN